MLSRATTAARILLGDEAVALGAIDSGVTAAYSYPGTPATEILETILHAAPEGVTAHWTANEKTAYEAALGVSMAGRRALVAMKHVGLNVAADPFINSALVAIGGGLVVAVADDPGMHSSQNEQDSRYLAEFARIVCLEPGSPQEAYEMTREAFDVSEHFGIPVLVRLVTRIAHSRSPVKTAPPRRANPVHKTPDPQDWILIPGNARRRWRHLLDTQEALVEWSEASTHTTLQLSDDDHGLGVITAGIGRNHYLESLPELGYTPSHLHIGAYPVPAAAVRRLAQQVERILVIEEGYPFIERALAGVLPTRWEVRGRATGALPGDGELTPDAVRSALGLAPRPRRDLSGFVLPGRPPQLCSGCPHEDSFAAVLAAMEGVDTPVVMSDIGCYALGALPPYRAIESCVCMGASIGMAKGAADAGLLPALAVIGDSTFLHSGLTPLMDAVAHRSAITVIILDNGTVGMTGQQPTLLPGSRLPPIVAGLGIDPEHLRVIEITKRKVPEMAEIIRTEIAHPGPSVIIAVKECVEARKDRRAARES
ncbi:MAG TPA: indolepyruvate ferredoxin oxidoreductase [Actinobacteria bacterium]|nr:indolepyruvate ferredoxin oxidoreductase [Actinomycetota bacterium]